jgi:hypothetical protein
MIVSGVMHIKACLSMLRERQHGKRDKWRPHSYDPVSNDKWARMGQGISGDFTMATSCWKK